MPLRDTIRRYDGIPAVRLALFVIGILLVIAAPIIGLLPGPGGIFVFAFGFSIMLRYSRWTKRLYARAKKRWPRQGRWVDWGLRRASAKRRARRHAQGN